MCLFRTKMKKFFQKSVTAFAVFTLLFFVSCNDNRLNPDVDDVEVKLDIKHFEDDLFENKITDLAGFKKKYPYFFDDYTFGILGFNVRSEEEAFNQLMLYKTDVNVRKVYDLVKKQYGNFKPYEEELTLAYKHFKYHFPEQKIPEIVTYLSNFTFYMNPVGQNYIGIGLDMHMGEDFKYYDIAGIEQYWKKILIPQSIVTNHMLAQGNDLFAKTNRQKNFIDEMIYQGKLLYFLDAVTPNVPDNIKIGLTSNELEQLKKSEKEIWNYFVIKKLFYETEKKSFDRFFNPGPKTIADGVPDQTPAMIGRFSGWMLVRKYMEENKDVTLKELMNESDAEKIFQGSGYKP